MQNIAEIIARTEAERIGEVLDAVLRRYGDLFPDWEICVFSLEKQEDRNRQIDEIIRMLEGMKTRN